MSIYQGNGKGRGLSLPHFQVRHAANALLRYVMLPEEMGLTWRSLVSHTLVKPQGLLSGYPQCGFCTAHPTMAPSDQPRLGLCGGWQQVLAEERALQIKPHL